MDYYKRRKLAIMKIESYLITKEPIPIIFLKSKILSLFALGEKIVDDYVRINIEAGNITKVEDSIKLK